MNVNDVPNDVQIKTKTQMQQRKNCRKKKSQEIWDGSHTELRILYKAKSKLTCVKNYNCTYNFSFREKKWRNKINGKRKKVQDNVKKPHGEIIMIDRLQSKTVVNEYLEMPSQKSNDQWERWNSCRVRAK